MLYFHEQCRKITKLFPNSKVTYFEAKNLETFNYRVRYQCYDQTFTMLTLTVFYFVPYKRCISIIKLTYNNYNMSLEMHTYFLYAKNGDKKNEM